LNEKHAAETSRTLGTRGVTITIRSESATATSCPSSSRPARGLTRPRHGLCALAPYWQAKLGRDDLVGYEASARGGIVRCTVAGDAASDRVRLSGKAITIVQGEWLGGE